MPNSHDGTLRQFLTAQQVASMAMAMAMVVSLVGVAQGEPFSYRLVIPLPDLQKAVAPLFPITEGGMVAKVTLTDPLVQLAEGSDLVGLGFAMNILIPTLEPIPGNGVVKGGIRYDRDKGAFFLDDGRVTEFSVEGLPASYEGSIRSLAEQAVRYYLAQKPLYELDSEKKNERTLKSTLRSVMVEGGALIIVLGLPDRVR
jgi:hypothetical protein